MAVASLVLSLVGIIPCFWGFQIPGLLGFIFGLVGRKQIAASNGAQKGSGMALAGIIIGAILIAIAALLWIYIATSGDCHWDNGTLNCST